MNDKPSTSARALFAWPTASLRTYLVVMILLATLPIAGLMTYQIFAAVNGERERMQDNTSRLVKVLAQSVNRELDSTIDALHILSYSDAIQEGEIDFFERTLLTRPLSRPSWSGIYLVSMAGEVIFDTSPEPARRYPQDRDLAELWRRPDSRQALVSDLLGGTGGSRFATAVEVPVKVRGVPLYLLGARIPISVWQDLVERSGIDAGGLATLYDNDDRLIARNRAPERFVGTRRPASNQSLIDARPSGKGRLTTFEGSFSYAAWDTVALSGWGVGIGMPAAPIDAAHQQAILIALGTAAGCLLLGIVLALAAARKMLRPLQQLSHNEIPPLLEPIAVREISLLRDALLSSQQQNQAAQERLKYKRDLLQKRATEFETLVASSPIGLAFAQDPQCRVVTHNAAMDRLFGSNESQSTGLVRVLDNGRPLAREEQPLQRAAAQGEITRDRELELLVDGRPPVVVIVSAVPLLDTNGQPRGAIGAVVDITARKAAEERLISTEQRLRESQRLVDLAQEVGHVGFFHYRFDADAFSWTPGLAKLFGLAADNGSAVLADWVRRIGRSDWRRVLRQSRMALRQRVETETLNYCVDVAPDSTRWLSSRVHISYRHDGIPLELVGITVDMTEQKVAERERVALIEREQAARLDAEAANRAKDVFLAMLGHELRNPLSAITAAIEVLNRIDAPSETAINARRIIGRQTHSLARMMDDLLDVARVVAGQVLLTRQRFDLAVRVQRIVDTLEISGQPDRHQLTLDLREVWIDADPTRIEQIVNNVVINAIKYTPPGGHVKISVRPDRGEALLEVGDDGPGISLDLLPRIFDLFVQGERSLDRRDGGLGIGLALARRLVELHGGAISAENADPGTLMRIRLPAIAAPAAKLQAAPLPESRRRRVAIIEDNEDVLEGMRRLLEADGHTVWAATDGISGLALLLNRRPEVALVDIGLPGLTGFELAKRSRAGGYAGRMIALSGYGQASDVKQGLAAGFDAYELKPIDAQKLRGLLDGE